MFRLRTRFQAYSVLICFIGIAILLFFVLRFAGGQLMYTLTIPTFTCRWPKTCCAAIMA
jgi:hypothetical protein